MGMVTLHLVIGVGIFILPLFLLLFSMVAMSLAHLYILIGSLSFVASIITAIVLITKFVNQPEAHGFFSYSDTVASALMSLGLLLDGILYLLPDFDTPCYQYKVVYGLFIVPLITSFFTVLGMAIERFQTFALYRDRRRKLAKKFSLAWFIASWTLALCFVVTLLAQISEKELDSRQQSWQRKGEENNSGFYIHILDMDLFPGPHSQKRARMAGSNNYNIEEEEENEVIVDVFNVVLSSNETESMNTRNISQEQKLEVECQFRRRRAAATSTPPDPDLEGDLQQLLTLPGPCEPEKILSNITYDRVNTSIAKGIQCRVSSKPFIMYYLVLLFLLCFVTPLLITTSLNIFIQSAVQHTTYEVISHHQWLTLSACILMWGPSLVERLLVKWDVVSPPKLVVSVFLFLLGHTHNLIRSILHAVFAQQIHSVTWQTNQLGGTNTNSLQVNRVRFRWGYGSGSNDNKVKPLQQQQQQSRHRRNSTATMEERSTEGGSQLGRRMESPPAIATEEEDNGIEMIDTTRV